MESIKSSPTELQIPIVSARIIIFNATPHCKGEESDTIKFSHLQLLFTEFMKYVTSNIHGLMTHGHIIFAFQEIQYAILKSSLFFNPRDSLSFSAFFDQALCHFPYDEDSLTQHYSTEKRSKVGQFQGKVDLSLPTIQNLELRSSIDKNRNKYLIHISIEMLQLEMNAYFHSQHYLKLVQSKGFINIWFDFTKIFDHKTVFAPFKKLPDYTDYVRAILFFRTRISYDFSLNLVIVNYHGPQNGFNNNTKYLTIALLTNFIEFFVGKSSYGLYKARVMFVGDWNIKLTDFKTSNDYSLFISPYWSQTQCSKTFQDDILWVMHDSNMEINHLQTYKIPGVKFTCSYHPFIVCDIKFLNSYFYLCFDENTGILRPKDYIFKMQQQAQNLNATIKEETPNLSIVPSNNKILSIIKIEPVVYDPIQDLSWKLNNLKLANVMAGCEIPQALHKEKTHQPTKQEENKEQFLRAQCLETLFTFRYESLSISSSSKEEQDVDSFK